MTTKDIISVLHDKGLIKYKSFCLLVSDFLGYKDTKYIPGAYELSPNMGLEGMLNILKSARTQTDGSLHSPKVTVTKYEAGVLRSRPKAIS